MPTEPDNGDEELTEKLVGIALKEGVPIVAELVKGKILGFEDEENPLRYGTVKSLKLIKPDEDSEDTVAESNPSLEEFSVPFGLDRIGVEELREIIRQFPPHLLRERKVSGYNVFLGKCMVGNRDDDITPSEHVSQCNLGWQGLSEEEREVYKELAFEKNRIFLPRDALERDFIDRADEQD